MTTDDTQLLAQARLQLHLQYPDYEALWLEGYEEGLANIDESENPYPAGSLHHQCWSDGWWAAAYGEAPLFDLEGRVQPQHSHLTDHMPLEEQPLYVTPPSRFEKLGHIAIGLLFSSLLITLLYDLAV